MRKYIVINLLALTALISSPLFAASYEDGEAAFKEKNYKGAVDIWKSLAEQGDLASQLKLASMYMSGIKVDKDVSSAFMLYTQAAEQGSSDAMLTLGQIYMVGQTGVERDPEQARNWYLKAAKLGNAKAQFHYGATYFRGEGVTEDRVQAHAWMHVATTNGYTPASLYRDELAGVLSDEELVESKSISDQLLVEIK